MRLNAFGLLAAACIGLSASLTGCGTPIRGELPQVAVPSNGLLSPDEVKARTEALIKAKQERVETSEPLSSARRS